MIEKLRSYSSTAKSVLVAIVTGLLTDIIFDSLSSESYELQSSGQDTLLITVKDVPVWEKIIIVCVLFIIIWVILTVAVAIASYLVDRIRLRNKRAYNKARILSDCIDPVFRTFLSKNGVDCMSKPWMHQGFLFLSIDRLIEKNGETQE